MVYLPAGDGCVIVGEIYYRGRLRFLADDETSSRFLVINCLDVENYLAGVLPKELYSEWSIQTYRAVAVAARTFALFHATHSGVSRPYDLGDDQGSQVYGGLSAETDKSRQAVRQTTHVCAAPSKVQ